MKGLYEMITSELYEKKSISALLMLLEGGRELSFKYDRLEYAIVWKDKKIYLTNENTKEGMMFDEPWQLLEKAEINGVKLLSLWESIELLTLY